MQAVEEVNRNNIRAEGRLYELKALQDAKKASEYLALARTLSGYGDVVFPHCACDSRKEGHVIPAVGECSNRYPPFFFAHNQYRINHFTKFHPYILQE